ncbi:hypothetical protein AC578_2993 [Pseudocercospora eumusae]|uniref:Uncharacterized protein n=1 Tax=Pseudocercospora eumusae TaxID=321146 RepID=A0A139GX51_9PEZI|nr:hypothetical protein AC578_2993 [Pseudocercospora eumusae]
MPRRAQRQSWTPANPRFADFRSSTPCPMALFNKWAHNPLLRVCKVNQLAYDAHRIAVVRERALHFLMRHRDSLDLCFCTSAFEAQRTVAGKSLNIHCRGPAPITVKSSA